MVNRRIRLLPAAFIFVGLAAAVAWAAPAEDELALARTLAGKCGYAQIGTDADGHVAGLFLSNKKAYAETPEWLGEKVTEVSNKKAPELTDADLPLLRKLPHLRFLKFQGQLVSGAGYAGLADLKQLEYLGLHSIDRKELGDKVDPTCILVANELPNLRRFDYKHNFRIRHAPAEKLKGTPKLEYLHLDNACCGPSVVPFILACPNLTRLELHRTAVTPDDLAKIVETNTKITDIRIRPRDARGLQPGHLKLVGKLPALETLCFGGNYNRMDFDYERDLAFLADMPTLKTIVAPVKKKDDPAFKTLVESCPKKEITFSYY
jgi:hypothetical protein